METRKFSHGPGIGLIVPNLLWYNLLPHSDFPAENEWNLPRGFRDRPIATGTATRFRPRLSWALWCPWWRPARAWRPRARDVARDVTGVQQIGIEVLSMPDFEFLKSDHYWRRYSHFRKTMSLCEWLFNRGCFWCWFMGQIFFHHWVKWGLFHDTFLTLWPCPLRYDCFHKSKQTLRDHVQNSMSKKKEIHCKGGRGGGLNPCSYPGRHCFFFFK